MLRSGGAGDFAEVDTVVAGTGGRRQRGVPPEGTFTAQAGGAGEYGGEICT